LTPWSYSFLNDRKTHVVCCSLREGHTVIGNERMSETEAQAKVDQFTKQSGGKVRYWTEKADPNDPR
jgi:hypothetical protein